MFATLAFITSIPVHLSPFCCLERSLVTVSIGSIPAVSANVNGTDSIASANFSAASCSLPSSDLDHNLSFADTKVSGAPPPATTNGFSNTSFRTIKAS